MHIPDPELVGAAPAEALADDPTFDSEELPMLPPADPVPDPRADGARCDAALAAWRDTTVARKEAWVAEEAARREVGRRRLIGAMIGGAIAASAMIGGVVGWQATRRAADAPAPDPDHTAAVVMPAPAEAPPVGVHTVARPADVDLVPGSVRTWRSGGHVWTRVDHTHAGPVELRWRDAAGRDVLEPWPCVGRMGDGVTRCLAGRSEGRLQAAIDEGATPGGWTVRACEVAGDGCELVGVFLARNNGADVR